MTRVDVSSRDGQRASVLTRLLAVFMLARRLATFPAAVAHEATHVAAASPWLEDWGIVIERDSARAILDWRQGRPDWAVIVGHLAPFLVGTALGAVVLAYTVLYGFRLPATVQGWGELAIALLLWVSYTSPSASDLKPLQRGDGE